jgi:ferredoxin
MPKVTFEREQVVVEARAGQNLLEVCEQAGIDVFRGMWPGLHCNRVKGWCNRCKVWVLPGTSGAINEPTSAEKMPVRLNGRVSGSLRLACQVTVNGDVAVHTRSGGPDVKPTADWQPVPEHTAWKERWERRHDAKPGAAEEEEATDDA